MRTINYFPIFIFVFLSSFIFITCSKDYEKLETENGRQLIIDKANNYLTAGQCDEAIDTMLPLYMSPYKDNKIRILFASANACKGGFGFMSLITSVILNAGSDIWSPLVLANHSKNIYDKKVEYLNRAAEILRTTSSSGQDHMNNYLDAVNRPADANLFMGLLQLSLIGVTISGDGMGAANITTGKKTLSIAGKGSDEERCRVALAFATIRNSFEYAGEGPALNEMSAHLDEICTAGCPSNLDPSVCTIVEQAVGAQIIDSIDGQWSLHTGT